MDKISTHLVIFILVIICVKIAEGGVGGRSSQSAPRPYYRHPYHYNTYKGAPMVYGGGLNPYSPQMATKVPETKRKGGSGLTAWGIVGVILAVIFCGTGVYYCARFYPIFCKKERNDNFEL